MKRNVMLKLISLCAILLIVLAACGDESSTKEEETNNSTETETNDTEGSTSTSEETLSVGYYVNSTLGDKSFFDSAQRGIEQAKSELGYEIKTIEGGDNQADWPAGFESMVASKQYDVIVVGTSQMTDILNEVAQKYPDQKFIFFDDIVNQPNVYSMTYSQSDGSFLAGAFAALVTTNEELENANPEKIVGFVGGMDIPIIKDFESGFQQGVQYVDSEVKVIASYIGNFTDSPKAKELTLAQINSQKADIIYQVAAAAGLGTLEAANEKGVYSIGVDSNQNDIYPGSVLSSMLKNIDTSILRALKMFKEGTLTFGNTEHLGIAEGGVGLAKDALYEQYVPQSIKDKMNEIEQKVIDGEIVVESTLD